MGWIENKNLSFIYGLLEERIQALKAASNYKALVPCICINILNFTLFEKKPIRLLQLPYTILKLMSVFFRI